MPVPDSSGPGPEYVRIADDLRDKIREGRYSVGDYLPSQKKLAAEYHVAVETLRDAQAILRRQGIIEPGSTRGMYVSRLPGDDEPSDPRLASLEHRVANLETYVEEIRAHLDHHQDRPHTATTTTGEIVTDSPAKPEPQPVVAAIVTSARGVLVGKRNDGKPPWTFIAGEIEPGESPEDAGVREVKEETGLLVEAAGIIGRRVHPKTNRTMIYMSALPKRFDELDVFVGDEDELCEVRWVSLTEAGELMQPYGMFEPVREFLARELPGER